MYRRANTITQASIDLVIKCILVCLHKLQWQAYMKILLLSIHHIQRNGWAYVCLLWPGTIYPFNAQKKTIWIWNILCLQGLKMVHSPYLLCKAIFCNIQVCLKPVCWENWLNRLASEPWNLWSDLGRLTGKLVEVFHYK